MSNTLDLVFLDSRRRRLAGAERGSRFSQGVLNPFCDRVRATEHAPGGPCRIFEDRHALAEIGIESPVASLRLNQSMMLDGYGWAPLSGDFDYPSHMDRIKLERFRHEQFAT